MKSILIILLLWAIYVIYSCNNPNQQKENTTNQDSINIKQTNTLLSKRFGDPNSPYCNEDSFISILQSQLQSQWYTANENEAIQKKLILTLQNRPGHSANDFTYITPAGDKKKLYDIKAKHLLLFFYNPECEACKETKAAIIASTIINNKIKTNQLSILAIYNDKDETIWRKHLPEMPKDWIHGKDEDEYLYKNNIYDLKAIPAVYLLDKNKKVVLKDCMELQRIEKILDE